MQQNTTKSKESGLTAIQEQTAILLASGESITSVAEQMNVNRSTIYLWQGMLTFQCFYNKQAKDIREGLKNRIFKLADMALNVLKDSLQSDNEQLRLKASLAILDRIESTEIGRSDAREVLKEEATFEGMFESEASFHEEVYQKLLKENGLK